MDSNRHMNAATQVATAVRPRPFVAIGAVPGVPADLGYGDALIHEWEPAVSSRDICDLLEAAGPLSVDDIAGGLGAPAREVSLVTRWMLDQALLDEDEWGRFTSRLGCPQEQAA